MKFRFTYSADGRPDFVATGDPSGWEKAAIGFERDPKLLSLVEFFKSSFSLYGNNGVNDGGRKWFLDTVSLNGADSFITQLIEIDDNDEGVFEFFFKSIIGIDTVVENYNTSHLVDFTLKQVDFWTKFIKRFNIPVDVRSLADLDGNVITAVPKFTLPLPNQIINQSYSGYRDELTTINDSADFAPGNFVQVDFNKVDLDEIKTTYAFPVGVNLIKPPSKFLATYSGNHIFNIRIEASGSDGGVVRLYGNTYVKWYIQVNDAAPVLFTENNFGAIGYRSTVYTYANTLNLNEGDQVYIYGSIIASITPIGGFPQFQIWSTATVTTPSGQGSGTNTKPSYLNATAETIFKQTSCDALLTHDIARGIIQRITNQDLFVSNYLGSPFTSIIYDQIGCGSMLAHMLGLHIRGYALVDKPLQISFQDWWEGINPMHCLGIGYEKIGGVDKIVCERAEHFFDDSNVSVRFMNIGNVRLSYDSDWQFNQFAFGCNKWESQAQSGIGSPSGIDDPQSQRSWTDRFVNIGKELKQFSKFILASLTIETARRLGIAQSSNYTYDNDIFGIALRDSGGGALVPETNGNFSVINNLLHPDTRYNSAHTPARFLLRWKKYWSGCLQDYLGSLVKYASGVGNFLMNSTKTSVCEGDETGVNIAENGSFVVDNDYLFLPTPLEINHYIDWPTYKYLRDHKNWSIEVSQTETDFTKCFIKSFEYIKAEGKCKMVIWPKTKFTIQEIESTTNASGIPTGKLFEIPEFADEFE